MRVSVPRSISSHGRALYTYDTVHRAPMRYDHRTQRWAPFGTGAPSRGAYTAMVVAGGYLWAATLNGIWRCRLPVGRLPVVK